MTKHSGNLFHPLLHAAHLVEARLRDRLRELDLHPRQARVLSALERIGEAHQKTLVAEFDITPASMSAMCDRLAAAGWIERQVDPNEKRALLIRLTSEGERKAKEVRLAWNDIDAVIVDSLGHEVAHSMTDLAGKLRDQLGGRIPSFAKKGRDDG